MNIVHLNIDMLIFLNVVAFKLEDNFITDPWVTNNLIN